MRDTSPQRPEQPFPAAPLDLGAQRVSSEWIDYNGHMNVAYYTLTFDRAFDVLLLDWLGMGEEFVSRSHLGPMALQSQTCYLGELLEGEEFRVFAHYLDHDEKRFHLIMEMRSASGARAATYETLCMNVDLEARRPAPYPDWVIARLEAMKAAQAGVEKPREAGQSIGIRRKS